MKKTFVSAVVATLAITSLPASATTYFYVQTTQAGANTQIDAANTSQWTITTGPTTSWSFGGGTFAMKIGPSTVEDITLSIYQGANASGPLVDSVTLTPSSFTQQFTDITFAFNPAVNLALSSTYFVTLTSSASTQGNGQYFIKGSDAVQLVDSNGTPIPPELTTPGAPPIPPVTAVPEPASMALLGAGLLGLAHSRRRRMPVA